MGRGTFTELCHSDKNDMQINYMTSVLKIAHAKRLWYYALYVVKYEVCVCLKQWRNMCYSISYFMYILHGVCTSSKIPFQDACIVSNTWNWRDYYTPLFGNWCPYETIHMLYIQLCTSNLCSSPIQHDLFLIWMNPHLIKLFVFIRCLSATGRSGTW